MYTANNVGNAGPHVRQTFLNDVFIFLTEVGSAGRIVNTGTSSVNSEFVTALTNNIYQKQIKYHVFNAVTNSELTELVPVFTIRPAFPTSVKKVNTSFKNVCRTPNPFLFRILYTVPATWQCVDHKNFVVPEALQRRSARQT
jgi:hypothetical protein